MKTPINYQNGRIYVIRNRVNEMVYIGGTTQSISKRFSLHKNSITLSQKQSYPLYKAMREIGKDNFYIELIESYPCDNKEALHAREGYWIRYYDSYKNGYNGKIEGRNQQQYNQDNAEKIRQYKQQYNQDNAERNRQRWQQYSKKNAGKLQKYRQDNAEKKRQYQKERVKCETCGIEISRDSLSKHKKSIRHLTKTL